MEGGLNLIGILAADGNGCQKPLLSFSFHVDVVDRCRCGTDLHVHTGPVASPKRYARRWPRP